MKSFDLIATEDNLVNSFTNDSIGRASSVFSFVNLLCNIESAFTIAVDGAWGNGKTFFVKQTKMVFDSLNKDNPFSNTENGIKIKSKWDSLNRQENISFGSFLTAYYDSWEHDNEDDPLLSLIFEIMKENYCIQNIPNPRDWVSIIAKLTDVFTSRNVSALIESLQGEDLFAKPRMNDEIRSIINSFFDAFLKINNKKLIVFIDELDRCSPEYAVKLLERVKHYMFNESVIFVFSINQIELQKTIRKHYGDEFNACRYLDRFFSLRFELPEVNLDKYINTLGLYKAGNLREATCLECIKQLNMSLREMSKYLHLSKMSAFIATDSDRAPKIRMSFYDDGYSNLFCYSVIVPLALALKICNIDDYELFINGKNAEWLEKILLSDTIYNWVFQYISDNKALDSLSSEYKHNTIKKFYNAIFVKTYGNGYQSKIGQVNINDNFKKYVIEAVSLASKYTSLSNI